MLQTTLHDFSSHQLLSMLPEVKQEDHIFAIPTIPPIDFSGQMFHWVLRNIDFKQWSLNDGPPVLCLTGPSIGMLDQLSSYIVDQMKTTGYSILPISCSVTFQRELVGYNSKIAAFIYTILQQQLSCSPAGQRTLIIHGFFLKLLEQPIVKGYHGWTEDQFDEKTFLKYMKMTLEHATTEDLVTSLIRAFDFEKPRHLLVAINGLDNIYPTSEIFDCLRSLIQRLQQRNPNARVLLTGQLTNEIMDFFQEFQYIQYDKERQGKAAIYMPISEITNS